MNKYTYVVICILFFFCSCKKHNYEDSCNFSFSDIPDKKELKGEILELADILRPTQIHIKDSVLFVINPGMEYFVSCYNLTNLEKTGEFLTFGSGPHEIMDLTSFQMIDSMIWIFDAQRRRLLQYSSEQFTHPEGAIPERVIDIKNDYLNRVLIVGNKLFANSLSYPDFRFSIYDSNGDFQENTGELPRTNVTMTPLEKWESYFCNMALKPDGKSIFVSYMETDLIEIYNSDGHLETRNHGPDHFLPARKEKVSGKEVRVTSTIGTTRDAYFNPVAFSDEIWVVYSGKTFDPSSQDYFMSNKIIVFDWDGSPLRIYTTDIPFYSLAVDKSHHAIYAVTSNPDFSIVRFNY
jgi:hypothetical protein